MLKETYGVPVYQEQVMEMAQVVAGFSLGQADILRRAMGKKKPEEMLKMKEMFLAGAKAKGYDAKTGERIFELLFAFSGYGFNKSHAAAYTIPAYHTIWLKANHPAEFIAANCTNDMNDTDRLAQLIREAREMGIEVLPPDVNVSAEGVHRGEREDRLRPPGHQERGLRRGGRHHRRAASGRARSPACWTSSTRIDSHEVNRKVAESLDHHGRLRPARRDPRHPAAQPGQGDGGLRPLARGQAVRAGVSLRGRGGRPRGGRRAGAAARAAGVTAAAGGDGGTSGFFFSGHPLDPWRETHRAAR